VSRPEAASALWDRLADAAREVEDWSLPVPACPGWDVHDLIGHCSGIQRFFDAGVSPSPPPGWDAPEDAGASDAWTARAVAARRDWSRDDVMAELAAAREGHADRLNAVTDWDAPALGPVGETTEDGLFRIRCYDLWVHLQDLREAVGAPMDLDDRSEAAVVAHQFVVELVPWLFAKRAGAGDGASLRLVLGAPLDVDRTVAVSGRRAAWTDQERGDDLLEGAPAALTMLASGRRDPSAWRADGLLDWSGPSATTFVTHARLL
jgi:uncharacterized protein (TIGR03083 family)